MKSDEGASALKKAVYLLNHLSGRTGSCGVSEMAESLKMPKSTVHRILSVLLEDNIVTKNESGRYGLGPTVLYWSSGYELHSGIVDVARPFLERIRDETRETVHISVYKHGKAQYVGRLDSPQTVVLRWSRLGTTLPMYCTAAGRAILASLPEDELDFYLKTAELLPRTDHTVTSPDILKDKISLCRSCGYAEENQENEENIRCVGAAILSRRHYPLGAISITAPSFRFDNAKVLRYGPLIAETARELSALL